MRRVRGNSLFIQFLEIFETKNSIYMVLEFIEGSPLLDLDYPAHYPVGDRFAIMK